MSTQPVAVCDTWRADRGGVEGMGNLPSASPIERPAQNHDVDSVLRDLLHRDSLDTQPVVEHSDGHPEPKRPKLSDSAGVSTGVMVGVCCSVSVCVCWKYPRGLRNV